MLLVTNYWASFPKSWVASNGLSGTSVSEARTVADCMRYCDRPDTIFLINCDPKLLYELAATFSALPMRRKPLISVDLVLRRPLRPWHYLPSTFKRLMLTRVDHHILFHKDVRGYQKYFGVHPERCSFVPFKSSLPLARDPAAGADGEYVLCYGRSQRDWKTFFEAMKRVPYPGATSALSLPKKLARRPGLLPKNVRLLADEDTQESQVRIIGGAKLLVLPILKSNVAASGLSIGLNAMALGKCVIGSEGPAFTGIFSEEMLQVPPGDPDALAATIRRAWEDDELRRRTGMRAHQYAAKAGGRDDIYQRVIDATALWYTQQVLPRGMQPLNEVG